MQEKVIVKLDIFIFLKDSLFWFLTYMTGIKAMYLLLHIWCGAIADSGAGDWMGLVPKVDSWRPVEHAVGICFPENESWNRACLLWLACSVTFFWWHANYLITFPLFNNLFLLLPFFGSSYKACVIFSVFYVGV